MKTASEAKISQINAAFKNNPPEGAEETVEDHLSNGRQRLHPGPATAQRCRLQHPKEWVISNLVSQQSAQFGDWIS
jgi:hypothetical protein